MSKEISWGGFGEVGPELPSEVPCSHCGGRMSARWGRSHELCPSCESALLDVISKKMAEESEARWLKTQELLAARRSDPNYRPLGILDESEDFDDKPGGLG